MGICTSSQMYTNKKAIGWQTTSTTIQIIHSDNGKLQEFKHQVKAGQILSQSPNYFLCSSESMLLGDRAQQLGAADQLYPGQIYFLIPITRAKIPFSISSLCALAIKASAALSCSNLDPTHEFSSPTPLTTTTNSFQGRSLLPLQKA